MHAIILILLFKIRTILPLYHFEDLKKKKLFRIITVFGLKINHSTRTKNQMVICIENLFQAHYLKFVALKFK